jgi:hypothetical protein
VIVSLSGLFHVPSQHTTKRFMVRCSQTRWLP